jgi:uncharacterized protein YxjI
MESTTASRTVLDRNLFLVKEHTGIFKASNNFDIFDPQTGEKILEAREPKLGLITKLFRFTDFKRLTPFAVEIREPDGRVLVRVKRGMSFFLSSVAVEDGDGNPLGSFKQKFFSIGGAFRLLDTSGEEVAQLKGRWTSWDFRFMTGDVEIAHIAKKWAGIGKELFTSADNYMVSIGERVGPGSPIRALILGAVVTIDMVLKE